MTDGELCTISDATFEYGSKGTLYCLVQAYPDAQINWYHNNSRIEVTDSNNNLDDGEPYEEEVKDFKLENNSLVIINMTARFVGQYKCEVTNAIKTETFTVNVRISGLGKLFKIVQFITQREIIYLIFCNVSFTESPLIETENTEIVSNLGDDYIEITCK